MSNKTLRYVSGAAFGAAMCATGITWQHPAFWVGMVYGIVAYIIGQRESTEQRTVKG